MRGKRIGAGIVAAFVALLFAVQPAAAARSVNEQLINALNGKLLAAAIPIAVLVEVILIYTVWKFRAANQEQAKPTQENRRLEITWTVATAIVLLFVGFASYQVLGNPYVGQTKVVGGGETSAELTHPEWEGTAAAPEGATEIEVVAKKYFWTFHYPGENVTTTDQMVMPANKPVYLHITSTDWLHAFHVPKLALKQDAFPAQYNTLRTKATTTGTYQLYCAEYCGIGHSQMLGSVKVVSQEDYQQWLDKQKSS